MKTVKREMFEDTWQLYRLLCAIAGKIPTYYEMDLPWVARRLTYSTSQISTKGIDSLPQTLIFADGTDRSHFLNLSDTR